jgi:tricarballylate dehydrogenase
MAKTFDVIVVGSGHAGLIAALSAQGRGARVLVLEAGGVEDRGGNSRYAAGVMRFVHDGRADLEPLLCAESRERLERVEVAPYSAAAYRADLRLLCGDDVDPALVGMLVDGSHAAIRWLREQGVEWELLPGAGAEPVAGERPSLRPGGEARIRGGGPALIDRLLEAFEAGGGTVRFDSPVEGLIASGDTVRGVRVRRPANTAAIGARSVVLACGGFAANPEMRARYLGFGWDLVKVRGTRFNDGRMLAEALAVGAAPYGNWSMAHATPVDLASPEVGDVELAEQLPRYSYPYGLLVNAEGRRFLDEGVDLWGLTYAQVGRAIRAQPGGVAFQVFDQRTVGLLTPAYRTGTPVEAGSPEELAGKLGLPTEQFVATILDYNAACRPGEFDPERKDSLGTEGLAPAKSNWALPLDRPPYVAYAVTCGVTFTFGGLRIDERGRVLTAAGAPMPGLYGAGEILGGFFAHSTPSGVGLVRGSVTARAAGLDSAGR